MSEASPPDARDPRIERILLQTVPWDVRKKGGTELQESLRDLWEKAVRIGFQWGEEQVERARQEGHEEGRIAGVQDALEKWKDTEAAAAARREKDLEEERMWGFEVGWRLCQEENKVRSAVSVETAEPTDIVLDTDDILPTPMTRSVETQTDAPVAAVPPLDWAEDAGNLSTHSLPESLPSHPTRDISCLRTGVSQPFASLQRRHRRSPHKNIHHNNSIQNRPHMRSRPTKKYAKNTFHFQPPFPSFPPPHATISAPARDPPPRLDWDRDPRLRDLSRALTALGWFRPH